MQDNCEKNQSVQLLVQNLQETLSLFGSFPNAQFKKTPSGSLLYCSKIPAEEENYLLLPKEEQDQESSLVEAFSFFEQRRVGFICPLLPYHGEKTKNILIKNKMRVTFTLRAMLCETLPSAQKHPYYLESASDTEITAFAHAIWLGFDSEQNAPNSFVEFISACSKESRIRLYALLCDKQIAATGMLLLTEGVAGIYYVATLPSFRRKGFGETIMGALMGDALQLGYSKVGLFATQQGYPLYRKCAFQDVFSAEVYSHSQAK